LEANVGGQDRFAPVRQMLLAWVGERRVPVMSCRAYNVVTDPRGIERAKGVGVSGPSAARFQPIKYFDEGWLLNIRGQNVSKNIEKILGEG